MNNLNQFLSGQTLEEAASKIGGSKLPLVPNGIYEFMAVEATIETKDGVTSIKQKSVIRTGEHAGKEFTSWFEIANKGGEDYWKVEKGLAAYALFCIAVGFPKSHKVQTTEEALRKPFLASTETKKGKNYINNEGKEVEGSHFSYIVANSYKPLLTGTSAPAAAPVTAGAMPWDAA